MERSRTDGDGGFCITLILNHFDPLDFWTILPSQLLGQAVGQEGSMVLNMTFNVYFTLDTSEDMDSKPMWSIFRSGLLVPYSSLSLGRKQWCSKH